MSNSVALSRPRLKGLLIDLSGNLHIGPTPTPNAVEALQRLQKSGIPFRLCSNTSKESTDAVIERLNIMGFKIPGINSDLKQNDDHDQGLNHMRSSSNTSDCGRGRRLVWTSIGAVARLLKNLNATNPFYILSESARHEVMEALKERPAGAVATNSSPHSDYDAVVIGLAPKQFDYENLNLAFRILKGEVSSHGSETVTRERSTRIPLIATHKAKYVQTESGLSLGPGPFVTALEYATGCQAHVVGKPTKEFLEMVICDMEDESSTRDDVPSPNSDNRRIAIIGDDVEADLGGGAIELDLWRVLVRTGKYRPGDENRPGITPPDEVFDSFAAFVDTLLYPRQRARY